MTLNEQFAFEASPIYELPPPPSRIEPVRAVVQTVLAIEDEAELHQHGHYAVVFHGRLLVEAEEAHQHLLPLLQAQGFTPVLQRNGRTDIVLAIEGLPVTPEEDTGGGPLRRLARWAGRSPWWLHLLLLLATAASTVGAGAALLQTAQVTTLGDALAIGGPFAFALLAILGVHEMGHYIAARYHRVKVTLPFFIPLPVPGSLGTLGAVIFIRSPLTNRKALFDVGVSGPLAGLVVALPLFVIGLLLPPVQFGAPVTLAFRGVGVPPLLDLIGGFVNDGNLSRLILQHPVALAAWFGVLLTVLNLLPLGQFDGGHVAYALLGRWAWPVAQAAFFILLIVGFFYWQTWLLWAFLAGLSGLRHPPPQNDITPLDRRRQIVAFVTIVLFLLILVPQPIIARQVSLFPASDSVPVPTMPPINRPTPTPFTF